MISLGLDVGVGLFQYVNVFRYDQLQNAQKIYIIRVYMCVLGVHGE